MPASRFWALFASCQKPVACRCYYKEQYSLIVRQHPEETPSQQKYIQNTFPALESYGQLVPLGFDITAFAPVAYQRRSLRRPSMDDSSLGELRA